MKDFGSLQIIADKIFSNERLTFEDGIILYKSPEIHLIGKLATFVREKKNGKKVFYSNNFHLNHTNICSISCMFCSFSRKPGEEGGYVFSLEEIEDKVRFAVEKMSANEIHIVGGHHPDLNMDYYIGMMQRIKRIKPDVYIKALTAPEIDDLSHRCDLTHLQVLTQLKDAGLDGMPGGGAEIFGEKTRQKICREKITASEWLDIHEIAHGLDLRTNATMLYGHIETDEDRVDHALRIRDLQDKTNGFQSFILLSYQASPVLHFQFA